MFGVAMAAEISVPTDYATIQEAIDAAQSGDTITVAGGSYPEKLNIDKSVTLQGDGTYPVINPAVNGYYDTAITIAADNITIQNPAHTQIPTTISAIVFIGTVCKKATCFPPKLRIIEFRIPIWTFPVPKS